MLFGLTIFLLDQETKVIKQFINELSEAPGKKKMSLVNECDYFDIRGHAKFETNLKK